MISIECSYVASYWCSYCNGQNLICACISYAKLPLATVSQHITQGDKILIAINYIAS